MSGINSILLFMYVFFIVLGIIRKKSTARKGTKLITISLILLTIHIILILFLDYKFEKIWADQFNSNVYKTTYFEALKLFLYPFLAGFLFSALNLLLLIRILFKKINKNALITCIIISLMYAVFAGLTSRSTFSSEEMLLFKNGQTFGVNDPILNLDVSFYIYKLPVLNGIQNNLSFFSFIMLALITLFYSTVFGLTSKRSKFNPFLKFSETINIEEKNIRKITLHIIFLLIIFVVSQIWAFVIEKWKLIANGEGARGINYEIPGLTFSIWVFAILCIILIIIPFLKWSGKKKSAIIPGLAVFAYFLHFSAVSIYPSIVQSTVIKTSEFEYEKPFIEHKIRMTRQAYGIDKIKVVEVNPANINQNTIKNNESTINNIRLHDYRAAHEYIQQLQRFRPYYRFTPIRFGQYTINGQIRQLMISAREMDIDGLPESARTWINRHFVYTHGYGVASFPVNEFTDSGEPVYAVKDIPVETKIGNFNPRIYHGLYTTDHVYTNTRQKEFDFPEGDRNQYTTYQGKTGIKVKDHKLLVAWQTDGFRLYYTGELTDETRLLYRRDIESRVKALYPFLAINQAYPALVEGRLVWIMDGFTYAKNYPYSSDYTVNLSSTETKTVDYYRNSVKIMVDAYDGTVKAYIIDKTCPIIKSWEKLFPDSFEKEIMPQKYRIHLKYPEAILDLKARVFELYHVSDPQIFYNKEDVYQISREVYYNQVGTYGPYFQMCRLPGQKDLRLNLMTMFVPSQTNIIRGLMGASMDIESLMPEIVFYSFPKTRDRRDGIMQFLSRVQQTPSIKERLTLWGNMLMGNMLVYPLIEGEAISLLYVQPVYIRSSGAPFPQIKMVILGDGANRIAWGLTFNQALANLLSERVADPATESRARTERTINVKDAVKQAFNDYLRHLRENNFAEAGKALEKVKTLMAQL